MFLSVERPEAPSHIAGLTILDPSSSPAFGFERYLEILDERLGLIPRFKWKLFEPPMGLDRAYWVEDEAFTLADHVHRVAIPRPGDRAALAEITGFLHAQPLDRSRPLWESWWIEGLEGGRVATLLKIHHCLMDGQSGITLSAILMDLSPEPARDPQPPEGVREQAPRRPMAWEIGRAAVSNSLRIPQAIVQHSRRAVVDGLGRALGKRDVEAAPPVPRVPFNGRLTRQRSFAFASIPLGPLRDAKKHFDVTMNDVLLEIVASSLRRGLEASGELPEEAIVGLCPVSLRQAGDERLGNQISSMPVSLATHLADVPSRLAAIHASAEAAKRRLSGGAFETLAALGECLVPGALRLLTRAAHGFPSILPLPANLVVSNVRGLTVPMYLAGARVEEFYPLSMLQVANGMNVTAVSHDDQVDFGFLVDSKLVRNPWVYADGVHTALRELEAAIDSLTARSRPDGVATAPNPSEREADEREAVVIEPVEPAEAPPPAAARRRPRESARLDDEPMNLQMMMSEVGRPRARARRAVAQADDPADEVD